MANSVDPDEIPSSTPKLNLPMLNRFVLCWGLMTCQALWVILCRLPEKGRTEIEEIVEEMKERDGEERGTGMKVKKRNKNILLLHLPAIRKEGLAQL